LRLEDQGQPWQYSDTPSQSKAKQNKTKQKQQTTKINDSKELFIMKCFCCVKKY
jgi:hypothetical protein